MSGIFFFFQVNCSQTAEMNVPFGGYKQSGIGRELGEYALDTCVVFFLDLFEVICEGLNNILWLFFQIYSSQSCSCQYWSEVVKVTRTDH